MALNYTESHSGKVVCNLNFLVVNNNFLIQDFSPESLSFFSTHF